jgi:hypothetical protein
MNVALGTAGGSAAKHLGPKRWRAPAWREPVNGAAPRLGPRELIGRDVTRRGVFADKDPLATPQLWSVWRWLGLAFWGGTLWQSIRRARARVAAADVDGDVGQPR